MKDCYSPTRKNIKRKLEIVALDCEFVGIGPGGLESFLARVTMLDHAGTVLMDEYVKPSRQVTDYRTHVSGITPQVLAQHAKLCFTVARKRVLRLLKGKLLVGHGLDNDLKVLQITHPWFMIRDTACFKPYMKLKRMPVTAAPNTTASYDASSSSSSCDTTLLWCPRSLKELSYEFLHREIQTAEHSSHEDALAALDLYRLVWRTWDRLYQEALLTHQHTLWVMHQQQQQQIAAEQQYLFYMQQQQRMAANYQYYQRKQEWALPPLTASSSSSSSSCSSSSSFSSYAAPRAVTPVEHCQ